MTEEQNLQELKNTLTNLGYPVFALKTYVQALYGKRIDLVAYESDKPKIVFEVKERLKLPLDSRGDELRFHPSVRQAQSLAQEIGAPYFAVSDGSTILWFDIDREEGRPRLLERPVLPSAMIHEDINVADGKSVALRAMWTMFDTGRTQFGFHDCLVHAGMTVLARLLSERGDARLENILRTRDPQLSMFDQGLSDLDVARTGDFYPEAFSLADNFQLSRIPVGAFDAAINEFIQSAIGLERHGLFRLPIWITDWMAELLQTGQDEEVADIYSNFGDGIAAIGRAGLHVKVLSIAPDLASYIWDKLRRIVFGFSPRDVKRIHGLDQYRREIETQRVQPAQIILAPPFGLRVLDAGTSRTSEDFLMEIALRWVRPGGRIVALVPEGILVSPSRKRTRQAMLEDALPRSIISLEQFMPGTNVKANIIVLDRKPLVPQNRQVMMAQVSAKDVKDRSNERINSILRANRAHLQNEVIPHPEHIWLVRLEDLTIDSWAARYYDPQNRGRLDSQYPTRHLRELATLRKGSPLTLEKNGPLLVIGPGAVGTLSLDPAKLDRTTRERLSSMPVVAAKSDILIHAVGPRRGQTAVVNSEFDGLFVSRNIIILRPISSLVSPEYLAIALSSGFVRKQLEERATGSVIRQFSVRRLQDLEIPVPDAATQEAIVAKVADAQRNLIAIEQQALFIESARKLRQGEVQEILDSIHLGGGANV